MSREDGLPHGWCWATLGDLATQCLNGYGKRRQEAGTPTIVLRLADIEKGEVSLGSPRRVNASPDEVEKYRLLSDDLLGIRVNGSPDLVGRLIRFSESGEPVLFCDHFIRVRLRQPSMARFVRLYGDTKAAREHVNQNKVSSAGQNTISQGTLERTQIPLPPLEEQHRIVAKVEELFSDLDAAVAMLERVKAKLKRYRAAVLKAAIEGKLTEEWRERHRDTEPAASLLDRILEERRRRWEEAQLAKFKAADKEPPKNWQAKYEEPVGPDTTALPTLPKGWCWVTLDQVAECLDHMRVPINKKERAKRQGVIPYYGANGLVGFIDDYLFDEPLILVVEDETFVGREKPFSYKITGKAWVNNHAHILRAANGMAIDFLNQTLMFYPFTPLTTGTTGRRKLTKNALMLAPIRLPPAHEQAQVGEEVARRLSIIEEIEAQVEANLKRATRLRQGILKRAFEGKLVPQDPTDEPADKLLERIRASRDGSTASTPQRGRRRQGGAAG
jgi:type I restriction enzyme, S subunit